MLSLNQKFHVKPKTSWLTRNFGLLLSSLVFISKIYILILDEINTCTIEETILANHLKERMPKIPILCVTLVARIDFILYVYAMEQAKMGKNGMVK